MTVFFGTKGDDLFVGADGSDGFDMRHGAGSDTVIGGAGDDSFEFGNQFDATDQVEGGEGNDHLALHGNYDLTLTDTSMSGIEGLTLADGKAYALTLADGNVAAGDLLVISADASLSFDGSAETDGRLAIGSGGAHNTILGGHGDDSIGVSSLGARDRIDGGDGYDDFSVAGLSTLKLKATTLQNVESIDFTNAVHWTMADGNLAAGATCFVIAAINASLEFDASAERDGSYRILGFGAADHLIGGRQADTIDGSDSADTIEGGRGADDLRGGFAGGDVFVYQRTADSHAGAVDLIEDLGAEDFIDLSAIDANTAKAGDQAFHLAGAFTKHAGELVLTYDAGAGQTTLAGDVDGNGKADLVVTLTGDHTGFAGFVL